MHRPGRDAADRGPDLDQAPSTAQSGRTTEQELADLNTRPDALATAMRTLTTGFDEPLGEGLDEQRLARASRLTGEILPGGRAARCGLGFSDPLGYVVLSVGLSARR